MTFSDVHIVDCKNVLIAATKVILLSLLCDVSLLILDTCSIQV